MDIDIETVSYLDDWEREFPDLQELIEEDDTIGEIDLGI